MGFEVFEQFTQQLGTWRVVPVVVVDSDEESVGVVTTLTEAGLPVAEITMRTPNALAALRAAVQACPDATIGAGTVTSVQQLEQVVEAGAKFIVSPGVSAPMVQRAQQLGVPITPGVATATELMLAADLGLDTVKFFPASIAGGLPAIRALGGPFPQMRFVPTGGVNATNLREYLDVPAILAVGGSWLVKRALITAGNWNEIGRLVREARTIANAGE